MTSPDPALPTARREVAREVCALLLLVVGVVGLLYAAYQTDPLLALALGSAGLIAGGLRLGMTTIPEE